MEWSGNELIVCLVVVEVLQLLAFWAFVRYRYKHSLQQMSRLTGQMATSQKPATFYIDGPREVQEVSRHLETIGSRLEQYERAVQEEVSNLNLLLANMVEGVMVVDQKHVVRLFNDELLNLFQLKQSPLGRTVLESLREARVEVIVAE
jgi:signal transduction histidine kinase